MFVCICNWDWRWERRHGMCRLTRMKRWFHDSRLDKPRDHHPVLHFLNGILFIKLSRYILIEPTKETYHPKMSSGSRLDISANWEMPSISVTPDSSLHIWSFCYMKLELPLVHTLNTCYMIWFWFLSRPSSSPYNMFHLLYKIRLSNLVKSHCHVLFYWQPGRNSWESQCFLTRTSMVWLL